jgi:glycosyl transferase family 25
MNFCYHAKGFAHRVNLGKIKSAALNKSMHLKDYFSKIYVINLPERVDRRREIEQVLLHMGIESNAVNFFPGIRPKEAAGFRTAGARGCFLSHLQILKSAEKQNLDSVLIIEDDLEIMYKFLKVEHYIVNLLSFQKWDVVYLGHSLDLQKNDSEFALEEYSEAISLTHFVGFHRRIISPLVDFLQALLKEPAGSPKGGPMDIDGAYSTFRLRYPETITLVANPSLGYQRSSRGDISPSKWFDHLSLLRYLISKYKKIKHLAEHREI